MPKAEITGYVITKTWDDGSSGQIKISSGVEDISGPFVRISAEGGEEFYFHREAWPLIRDKVDELFEQLEQNNE